MLEKGYIRIPRLLFQSSEWKEKRVFSRFEAILSLYEQASYTNGRLIQSRGLSITLERGQLITTVRVLADLWCWSKSKVSRFLHELRDSKRDTFRINIDTINGTSATLVTICNYDGNATEVVINGTNVEGIVGAVSDANCGTLNNIVNKDIERKYSKINTHTLISLFTESCARVHEERSETEDIFNELRSRGCFSNGGDCYKIGLGMILIGQMWGRFITMQRRMTYPMTLHQANSICEQFQFADIIRVLERMANTVDLEKRRKSIYHTLRQWLLTDYELKKKSEDARRHIYPGKL